VKRLLIIVCHWVILLSTYALAGEVHRFQIPLENSPVIGPSYAPITIVEFLDYQ
jgi:hypothetical protein